MPSFGLEYHVVLTALLIDCVVGDPQSLYRRVPHPVALLGKLVELLERGWHGLESEHALFVAGLVTVLTVVAVSVLCALALERFVFAPLAWGWLLEALVASTLLAFRSLHDHVRDVAVALRRGLDEGRATVGHIVGRDPASLDEGGVARAAIESLAENFSDAVVVPLFWYTLAGLPGLFAYKAVNTLDSMLGHRTPRYLHFGRAAARLDDVVNYVPARLAGLYVVAGAFLMPGASGRRAFTTMLRDAPRHRSPNAGWQEAAFAGALDFALAGPRRYPGEVVSDAWMGDGPREIDAGAIHRSLKLYLSAGAVVALTLLVLWWLA